MMTCQMAAFVTTLVTLVYSAPASGDQVPPAATVLTAANDCGFTAETLIVADLEEWSDTILLRLQTASAWREALAARHAVLNLALTDLSALSIQASQQPDDEALANDVANGEQAVASAQAEVEEARSALRSAALQGLPQADVAQLSVVQQSASFDVPAEFRVKVKTDEEWKVVEGALRSEQRAERKGTLPPESVASVLAELRSDPEVIAAKTRLLTHLASVESTFEQHATTSQE